MSFRAHGRADLARGHVGVGTNRDLVPKPAKGFLLVLIILSSFLSSLFPPFGALMFIFHLLPCLFLLMRLSIHLCMFVCFIALALWLYKGSRILPEAPIVNSLAMSHRHTLPNAKCYQQ